MKFFRALAACVLICATSAQAQTLSPEDLARRTIGRRAIEAVNWGTPRIKPAHIIRKVILRQIAILNYVNPF